MPVRNILPLLMLACVLLSAAAAEDFALIGTEPTPIYRYPVDARGEAMGLATTVNPTGATAFWWNPAPLPESPRVLASFSDSEQAYDALSWQPLAIRASWRNFSAGYLWGRLRGDPILIRTAYEPEGDGRMFEPRYDLHQLGVSVDLVPWLTDASSTWTWTLGANARYFRQRLPDQSTSTWDADAGTSVAWLVADDPVASLRVHGTGMVRNLVRGVFEWIHPAALPRYYHFGLGLEAGLGAVQHGQRLLVCTVAYAWHRDLENVMDRYDSDHIGAEVLLGGILALRAGHRDYRERSDSDWSWGAGLQYRFDVGPGVRAAVDYASHEQAWLDGDRQLDHWTFSAGIDLP